MPVYVVSYDIKQGDGSHDYQDLYAAFDAIDSHKILLSVYLVSSTASVKELAAYFQQHMDAKDRLWVSEVHAREYSGRAMAGTSDWLKRHPPAP